MQWQFYYTRICCDDNVYCRIKSQFKNDKHFFITSYQFCVCQNTAVKCGFSKPPAFDIKLSLSFFLLTSIKRSIWKSPRMEKHQPKLLYRVFCSATTIITWISRQTVIFTPSSPLRATAFAWFKAFIPFDILISHYTSMIFVLFVENFIFIICCIT